MRIKTLDVLAVGELNPDLVLARIDADAPRLGTEQRAASCKLTLGSSTAICAVGIQRLGLRTAIVARVGEDDFGRFCTDFLVREGVGVDWIQSHADLRTGITVALAYPRDRLLATYAGAMETLSADDVPPAALAAARHLHVASFYLQTALQPGLADLFARARQSGLTTSLDTGWDPAGSWDTEYLSQVLAHTDVFLPNDAEIRQLSRVADLGDAAAWALDHGARAVAVKRGHEGASSFSNRGRIDHDGFAIEPLDTTGAGDSFNAGYVVGLLTGLDARDRLRLANACGALAAVAVGGTAGFANMDGVRTFLDYADGTTR